MAFKTKAKNRQIIDDRQTLDAKHNNILQTFSDNKNNISDLYNELENVNSIINDLTIQNLKSPILNMLLQQQIWDYDDKKKILEDTIYRIKNNIDEILKFWEIIKRERVEGYGHRAPNTRSKPDTAITTGPIQLIKCGKNGKVEIKSNVIDMSNIV